MTMKTVFKFDRADKAALEARQDRRVVGILAAILLLMGILGGLRGILADRESEIPPGLDYWHDGTI